MLKPRKIPMRKCTGCQEMKNKRELIRVVRTENEDLSLVFSIDCTGKKSGRGAYICPNRVCFEKAYKSKGLERSFKQAVPAEIYEKLKEELELKDNIAGEPTPVVHDESKHESRKIIYR